MVATELITGMEDIVQHIKDLEAERDNYKRKWENVKNVSAGRQKKIDELKQENAELSDARFVLNDIAAERGSHNEALEEERVRLQLQNEQLQEEKSAMKEELAEKFYKHYDDMGYNKLNIARTVGPNLGRMIEHLIKQNKELQEENEDNLASLNFYTEQCAELKDERKQLKEEKDLAGLYAAFIKGDKDWWGRANLLERKKLQEENKKQKEENKKLKEEINHKNKKFAEWCEENKKLKEKNKELQEELDNEESAEGLDLVQIKKLKEENKKLEMKGNARKDIIKNMFECITADLEEVQDGGFYIKRDWGHKYIDAWNEIVTQEYKDALKEINGQLEGIEWETDGFQFDLNIVEEDSESEDE